MAEAPPAGWVYLPGGLFVPVGYHEELRKARDEQARRIRGRFFSDYRRFDASLGAHGASIQEKPSGTPTFRLLRWLARESPIDRALIDARIAQVRRVARPCWVPGKQAGFRVVHKRHDDPNFPATDAIRYRCLEVMHRLERVTPTVHATIRDFFTIATEEELVLDRKAMVIYRDRLGRPTQFHLVDGATIKPALAALLPYMQAHELWDYERAAQRYSEELNNPDVDLTTAAWVQEIDGRPVATWRAEEMSVDITNPTVEIDKVLYGRSVLEKSLAITATLGNILRYNNELFRTNFPEGVLVLFGDYSPEGLEAFKRQVLAEQAAGGNWRLPVILGGPANEGIDAKYLKVRDTPRDAMFMELFLQHVALKCAAYRAHPSILNIQVMGGQANSVIFQVNEEYAIGLAQEEGFHGLLDSFASWLTRALVKPIYPDLILIWDGLDRLPERERVQLRAQQVATYMTLNEVRAVEDLPPLPGGDVVLNPTYASLVAQQAATPAQAAGPAAETVPPDAEAREPGEALLQQLAQATGAPRSQEAPR